MTLKIAIVTPLPPRSPGGVERFTALLSEILEEAGHAVTVFDKRATGKSYTGILEPRRLGAYKLSYDLGRVFNRRRNEFDVVICNGLYGWNVRSPRGIAIAHGCICNYAEASRAGLSWPAYLKTRYLDAAFHTLSFRRHRLVVVSAQSGRDCGFHHGVASYTVIDNCLDTDLFRPRPEGRSARARFGLPEEAFIGIYAGRLDYRKGADILRAIAELLGEGHQILAATPAVKGDIGRILPLTGLSGEEIARLYNACDHAILPSRHEGWSLMLLEAMASGLPVVASRVGGAKDVAESQPGLAPWIVESLEPTVYRDKIEELRASAQQRAALGRQVRQYVLQRHTRARLKEQYLRVIEEVAGASQSRAG